MKINRFIKISNCLLTSVILISIVLYLVILLIACSEIQSSKYISSTFNVSVCYPKKWGIIENNYLIDKKPSRIEGEDGFLQLAAINGEDLTLDEVASYVANHKLIPYGKKPEVKKLLINDKEFIFIFPSSDQPEDMKEQSAFIIKYPQKIIIGNDEYYYFILYADKDYIMDIAKTFNFIKN